jgi:hypothetical protein
MALLLPLPLDPFSSNGNGSLAGDGSLPLSY